MAILKHIREPLNPLGWKRPLRLPSPTILTLPCPSTKPRPVVPPPHVSAIPPGLGTPALPWAARCWPHSPFCAEIGPDTLSKPPLAQLWHCFFKSYQTQCYSIYKVYCFHLSVQMLNLLLSVCIWQFWGLKNTTVKFIICSASAKGCQTCWFISSAFIVLH